MAGELIIVFFCSGGCCGKDGEEDGIIVIVTVIVVGGPGDQQGGVEDCESVSSLSSSVGVFIILSTHPVSFSFIESLASNTSNL